MAFFVNEEKGEKQKMKFFKMVDNSSFSCYNMLNKRINAVHWMCKAYS